MLIWIEKILFIALAGGSFYLAFRTFGQVFRIVQRAEGPDKIKLNELPRRLATATVNLVSQGGILRKNRTMASLFHFGIAWGFIFYLLVNGVDILEGFLPVKWHIWNAEHDAWWGNIYRLLGDLLTMSVLAGMIYFLIRRFLVKDKALKVRENVKLNEKARKGAIDKDSLIVGGFMLGHVGSRLMAASLLISVGESDAWQPFANSLAWTWRQVIADAGTRMLGWHLFWWLALGLIFVFMPYFPFTKHAHLIFGPINFATRPSRGSLGALPALDFSDETNEKFGAVTLLDLSATQVLDAFSCIMCNRCQDVCPAYNTGKELSPAAIEINKRYHIKDNFAGLASGAEDTTPLMDYALSESALWACTTCGACSAICPVGNEPMMDILDIRRSQVLMEDSYPAELQNAFQGMERRGNPWGATDSRMEWAKPLSFTVPTVEQNPDFEYLFWVGCAGAFEPGAQKTARAIATILDAAGVSFAVLGESETCTGDSARRAGNEYLFNEMALANIETLNSHHVDERRIVTSCPHCLTTIGTEYKELGGDYFVYHHTQLIADLVGRGLLKLNGDKLAHVTFHDPCYLGRHSGIYDDPRTLLEQAGATLLEMDNTKDKSFCCGAGGAQMWKEEEHGDESVSLKRFTEAEATGAKTLAVGCPFCAVMMRDAKSEFGSTLDVKDVAELIAENVMDERH